MCDTVIEEIDNWIQELENDAIRLGDEKLAKDICELSYYVLALKNGVSPMEDSGVASEIMKNDHPMNFKTWNRHVEYIIKMVQIKRKSNELKTR